MIQRILHVNVNCTDLERSLTFYALLGFKVLRDFGELNSPGMGHAFRLSAGHIRVVHLACGDTPETMRIDLVQWLEPKPKPAIAPDRPLNALGIGRLCLLVDNLAETVAQLKRNGIAFWTEPQSLGADTGINTVCFNDPNGTVLQLIEGV